MYTPEGMNTSKLIAPSMTNDLERYLPPSPTQSDLRSKLFHVVFHVFSLSCCVGCEGHIYQLVQDYPSPGRHSVDVRLGKENLRRMGGDRSKGTLSMWLEKCKKNNILYR